MLNLKFAQTATKQLKLCKYHVHHGLILTNSIQQTVTQYQTHYTFTLLSPSKQESIQVEKIKKRMNHMPIQYLTSFWHFRYLKLKLRRPVFIPRLETEWIITILNEKLQRKQKRQRTFVDLCCGSGVIGLSIAKELGYQGVMIDLNPKAVNVTNMNRLLNRIENIEVLNMRFEEYLENCGRKFDIIISNPPYIKNSDVRGLEKQVRRYESYLALKGGESGLNYVYYLLDNYQKIINKDGIFLIQYGGEPLEGGYQKYEKYVINDQYNKRRFILIENK